MVLLSILSHDSWTFAIVDNIQATHGFYFGHGSAPTRSETLHSAMLLFETPCSEGLFCLESPTSDLEMRLFAQGFYTLWVCTLRPASLGVYNLWGYWFWIWNAPTLSQRLQCGGLNSERLFSSYQFRIWKYTYLLWGSTLLLRRRLQGCVRAHHLLLNQIELRYGRSATSCTRWTSTRPLVGADILFRHHMPTSQAWFWKRLGKYDNVSPRTFFYSVCNPIASQQRASSEPEDLVWSISLLPLARCLLALARCWLAVDANRTTHWLLMHYQSSFITLHSSPTAHHTPLITHPLPHVTSRSTFFPHNSPIANHNSFFITCHP